MNINEIISADTLQLALRRWYVFLGVLALALILAMVTCRILPRRYYIAATVIGTRYENDITPSNESPTFSAAALLGGSTNDLPSITDFKLYSQLLISPALGMAIVDDPLWHRVFKKAWHTDHWAPPDTLPQHVTNFLFGLMGLKAWSPPDGFTVANYVQSHLSIVASKDSKLLTLGIWNADPELGKAIIALLDTRADSMVKELAQKRFRAKVEFLDKAISEADVEETRTALGTALAKAQTEEIYSFSNLPFAAEFLSLPAAPRDPQFPKFPIVLGIFVGLGVALFLFDLYVIVQRGTSTFGRASNKVRVPVKASPAANPAPRASPTGDLVRQSAPEFPP